jgi:hypothetical protein
MEGVGAGQDHYAFLFVVVNEVKLGVLYIIAYRCEGYSFMLGLLML